MSFSGACRTDSMKSTTTTTQGSSDYTPFWSKADACGWQIVGASVLGAIHERHGERNQDALSWWSSEGERPLAVLCVADGHGGSEYTRSHIGARCAVEQTQQLLIKELLPRILNCSALKDLAQFKQQLDHQFRKELVKRWLESIDKHLDDNRLTEKERSTQTEGPVARLYGTTLLAVLLTPALHLYIQLGDGDILTVSADGEVTRPPFKADSHLIANHTTSLCSKEAWRFVRIHFQPILEKPPALVMLATDGYANSFADSAAFEQVAWDIYNMIQQGDPAVTDDLLNRWLTATTEGGSGDDISVVIATDIRRSE